MALGDSVMRVGELGQPFFQLRPGEIGLSVFDPDAVEPPLEEAEILASFRPGSTIVLRSRELIASLGLQVISVPGADILTARLQQAHVEIRPGPEMSRRQFKDALRSLEDHG